MSIKFNITLQELNDAVNFAEKHGVSEHKTIRITVIPNNIIDGISVSSLDESISEHITNLESM